MIVSNEFCLVDERMHTSAVSQKDLTRWSRAQEWNKSRVLYDFAELRPTRPCSTSAGAAGAQASVRLPPRHPRGRTASRSRRRSTTVLQRARKIPGVKVWCTDT